MTPTVGSRLHVHSSWFTAEEETLKWLEIILSDIVLVIFTKCGEWWVTASEWAYRLLSVLSALSGGPLMHAWRVIGWLLCAPAYVSVALSSLPKLWGTSVRNLIFKLVCSWLPWGKCALSLPLSAYICVALWTCSLPLVSAHQPPLHNVFADTD